MITKEFEITLPSNVEAPGSFKNRIGNWQTKLVKRVTLGGKWEVALSDISYTKSWYNFNEDSYAIYYDEVDRSLHQTPVLLKRGIYTDINTIIGEVNERLKIHKPPNAAMHAKLVYNAHTMMIKVMPGVADGKYAYPYFTQPLSCALGCMKADKYREGLLNLHANEWLAHAGVTVNPVKPYRGRLSDQPIDLTGGFHNLLLYCDIVNPSMVGNGLSRLLRVVEVPSLRFGEQITVNYPNPKFKPLLKHDFDMIEIDIKDDAGETVPFQFGRVIATLRFRESK